MDNDFERDMIDRTARIETKLDIILETQHKQQDKLDEVDERATEALQSTKSAHHRIDDMQVTAMKIAGAVSTVIGLLIGMAELYINVHHWWG